MKGVPRGAQTHNSHIGLRSFRRFLEHREHLFDKHGVAKVIRGKVDLETIDADSWRHIKDASIAYQDVETVMREFFTGRFNRCK